jgi:hypothetical protein
MRSGDEALHVAGDDFIGVAVGVDGDHRHVDRCHHVLVHLAERLLHLGEGRGADVRAVRVTEIDDQQTILRCDEGELVPCVGHIG